MSRKISPLARRSASRPGSSHRIPLREPLRVASKPPVKPHLKHLKPRDEPPTALQVPKNLTSAWRFLPIRLTSPSEAPVFSPKSCRNRGPESPHRCNSRNIEAASGHAVVPGAPAPVIAHPCSRVKNRSFPEPAHVLSRTGSPASPNPFTPVSRSSSPDFP